MAARYRKEVKEEAARDAAAGDPQRHGSGLLRDQQNLTRAASTAKKRATLRVVATTRVSRMCCVLATLQRQVVCVSALFFKGNSLFVDAVVPPSREKLPICLKHFRYSCLRSCFLTLTLSYLPLSPGFDANI